MVCSLGAFLESSAPVPCLTTAAQVSQEVRVRSLILHNCSTATERQTRPGLRQACGGMTEGEERASVNNHSSERTASAFLTHHPHSVSVIGVFQVSILAHSTSWVPKKSFNVGGKLDCRLDWFIFWYPVGILTIYLSLHKTSWKGRNDYWRIAARMNSHPL